MFEDKEVELWKAVLFMLTQIILVLIIGIFLLDSVPSEAATLGDEPLIGLNYQLTQFVKDGGDTWECIPYMYEISDEDKEVLYRIVEAEVTGEGNNEVFDAKRNVASCVITRWKNGWAKTIPDVVFQKLGGSYQFTPVIDKRYWSVKVTDQTIAAVNNVLHFGETHNATYFCTRTCDSYISGFHSKLQWVFDDCEHTYFKEW